MSFEKRDPIPPGRYWIDIIRDQPGLDYDAAPDYFRQWAGANNVVIVQQEEAKPQYLRDTKPIQFFLFDVKNPTPRWGARMGIGLPNIATNEQSSSDIVDRPDPEPNILDKLDDSLQDMGKYAKYSLMIGGAMLVVLLISKVRK